MIKDPLQVQIEEWQIIFDSIRAWIFYKDRENRFIRVNKAFCDIMGTTREQLEGTSLFDIYPREQAEAFWNDDKVVMESGQPKLNIIESMDSPSGKRWSQTDKFPYRDKKGNIIGIIGLTNDITERKNAEDELLKHRKHLEELVKERTRKLEDEIQERKRIEENLLQSEEKFRNIFEFSPIGKSMTVFNGSMEVNQAYCKILGYTKEELKGKKWQDFTYPDDLQKSADINQSLMDGKMDYERYEKRYIHKNGSIIWVDITVALFKDNTGKPQFFSTAIYDITRRKEAESALQKTMQNLKRSNEELEQFAYVASHDLQEPLRMVASYTQLLERRYKDQLDQDARDFINFAVDGANRMQRLINDLLEFSRVTTRGKEFVKSDLSSLLGQAIVNLQNKIQDTSAMITCADLPFAWCDESQIMRVFQNLIDNAIKFKSEEAPRIHITGKAKGNQVTISVSDNGIGIDKIYSDRIFTIFQRLHNKTDYPGTGIGLAICKRTVERHGGKIWFESEPGKGTTFYFTLNKK